MSFSLYVHIPWCQSKCPYCDFNSHAAAVWPEAEYTRALVTELEHRVQSPPFAGVQVKTIFFGGGTPSLFAPGSIGKIIDAASRLCGVERDAEITLEANPGTVDAPKLAGLRAAVALALGGERIDARRALELNLITKLVPMSQLDSEVRRLARRLKGQSALVMSLGKQAIYDSAAMDYVGALNYLKEMVALVSTTEDLAEGVNAFLAKRAPTFKGR